MIKRFAIVSFIAVYLGWLGYGIATHTLAKDLNTHPSSYFNVWDMFCGWNGYASRYHIIAEGESGQHYDLAPAPWGEFYPYGGINRHHYDTLAIHAPRAAANILKHTKHEPIKQVFVIEEAWNKKYNMKDWLWDKQYDRPKDPYAYYTNRVRLLPDGTVLERFPDVLSLQEANFLQADPKIRAIANQGRSFMRVNARPTLTNTKKTSNLSSKLKDSERTLTN